MGEEIIGFISSSLFSSSFTGPLGAMLSDISKQLAR
jgi:hypothetical protein